MSFLMGLIIGNVTALFMMTYGVALKDKIKDGGI